MLSKLCYRMFLRKLIKRSKVSSFASIFSHNNEDLHV